MDAGEKMAKPTDENQTRSEVKSRASIKDPIRGEKSCQYQTAAVVHCSDAQR
jgi:hypothetical protein